jgi:hypothetical protein
MASGGPLGFASFDKLFQSIRANGLEQPPAAINAFQVIGHAVDRINVSLSM